MDRRLTLISIVVVVTLIFMPCVSEAKIVHIAVDGSLIALDDTGHVWAWGDNTYGQLGIGTIGGTYAPNNAQKVSIDNVTAIATSGITSYALKKDGTVWAWGEGGRGRLGTGNSESISSPVQVEGLTDIVAISAGQNCYALKKDGTVYSWGLNDNGQLGGTYGVPAYSETPVQIVGLTNIATLGEHGNYAVRKDGKVYAWGDNTLYKNPDTGKTVYGFLGDPSGPGQRPIPFIVPGLDAVNAITNGWCYSIFLKNDGTVWGWGFNQDGYLGDGTKFTYPVQIENGAKTIVLRDWVCTLPPVRADIDDVKQISTLFNTVTALKNDGTVWEWGICNSGSQYGAPGAVLSPVQVQGIDHVIEVKTSSATIVLKDDGTVWGWGYNDGNVLKEGNVNALVSSPMLLFEDLSPGVTTSPSPQPSLTSEVPNQVTLTPTPQQFQNTTKNSTADATLPSNSTIQPAFITVTPTPVPLPTSTSVPIPGFSSIAMLSCLFITAGILLGFARRKDR
ncbi:hypothetical protein [Methanocella sp. MCL-LM]|uniref:RCC1 domain-containing protein n=1 Tax=Methanocella sp. MCL-LM TaxID=3412035 RepID=UPI003C76EB58